MRMLKNTRHNVIVSNAKFSINVVIMMTKKEKKMEIRQRREGKYLKGERGMRRLVEVHYSVVAISIEEEADCYVADKWVLVVVGEDDRIERGGGERGDQIDFFFK